MRMNDPFETDTMVKPGLFLLLVSCCAALLTGCGESNPAETSSKRSANQIEIEPQIAAFCGDCHAIPRPDSFARSAWPHEVQKGYDFYFDSLRRDLAIPPIEEVINYYLRQAPDEIDFQTSTSRNYPSDSPVFHPIFIPTPPEQTQPGVSYLRAWGDDHESLLVCDMRSGDLRNVTFRGRELSHELLASVGHPAHVEPTDLDGDGRIDFLVADLGSFLPSDHQKGRVVWCHRDQSTDEWRSTVLHDNLGRVADIRPADFNSDGLLDIVVAEFGWRKTGSILLLENKGAVDGDFQFRMRKLDPRHGTIHVPVVDLNGDDRPDFLAAISQEHEVVDAFLNRGDGTFDVRRVFTGPGPAWGTSGLKVIDLDGDGDHDVLLINGDSLDSDQLKPDHSIQWLENTGDYPFTAHKLTLMPGVHRALPGDLDGDGDLDIVACAFLPLAIRRDARTSALDGLIWLEQVQPGVFVRHRIGTTPPRHLALELGDFDHDGRLDIATGIFSETDLPQWLTIWWNDPE
jgi:hypothetical protein